MADGHRKILFTETVFAMLVVLPLATLLCYEGLWLARHHVDIQIDQRIFFNPLFIFSALGFLILLFASTRINSYVLSNTTHIINSLKGKLNSNGSGLLSRKILVATQLSFSIIMIALIVIIVDQFKFIQESDKGFEDKNTILVKLRSAEPSRVQAFCETLSKINGISSVGTSSYYPGAIETKYVFEVETEKGMEQRLVPMMNCSVDYLKTLNIKIIKGRPFEEGREADLHGAFIVNETAAREFGWKDPIGKKIQGPVSGFDEAYLKGEVIGVARDFNFASLHSVIEPMVIFPSDHNWGNNSIYIKMTPLAHANVVNAIEKEFKAQWSEFPMEWEYLDSKYLNLYKSDFEMKNIFQVGLVISMLTSCLGIFSISALLVTLRTKEMGIRKVVGASSIQLFFLHTNSFLKFLFISILLAWPLIWLLSREWLNTFAYHVELNIWYFILPGLIALLITGLTSAYHGIRSAMVNPVEILKHE
jgi:putative ABC transport system permease protein